MYSSGKKRGIERPQDVIDRNAIETAIRPPRTTAALLGASSKPTERYCRRRTTASEWGREDSNLRRLSRRVYSPLPLAARALPQGRNCSRAAPALPADYDGLVERFDVIVVGAGPAGSTAAYRLATAGASVLLVDKARFPRDKPCGGGLTVRALKELPVEVDPVVEVEIDRFEFGFRSRARFERASREPLVVM